MKSHALLTVATLALAAPSLAQNKKATPAAVREKTVEATKKDEKPAALTTEARETVKTTLKDRNGQPIGVMTIEQTPQGLLFEGTLSNLPVGMHAFFIHEIGKCEAPGFGTAGGHFNPTNKTHGSRSANGKHAGDLTNIIIERSDMHYVSFINDGELTLQSMLDADGSAIVVHAGADDLITNPSGNAGIRIACGVITR